MNEETKRDIINYLWELVYAKEAELIRLTDYEKDHWLTGDLLGSEIDDLICLINELEGDVSKETPSLSQQFVNYINRAVKSLNNKSRW